MHLESHNLSETFFGRCIWKINNVAMRKREAVAYWFLIMKQILDSGICQNTRWKLDYISTYLVHKRCIRTINGTGKT